MIESKLVGTKFRSISDGSKEKYTIIRRVGKRVQVGWVRIGADRNKNTVYYPIDIALLMFKRKFWYKIK